MSAKKEDKKTQPEVEKVDAKVKNGAKSSQTEQDSTNNEEDVEAKVEGFFEKLGMRLKAEWNDHKQERNEFGRFFDGCFSVIFGFLWLILLNAFWDDIGILTSDFEDILVVANAAIIINIGMNFVLMIIRTQWFKSLENIINNILWIVIFALMISVFPFDLDGNWETLEPLIKPLHILLIVVLIIATIVESVKFLAHLVKNK